MKIGLIGLPQVGKTSIFQILTGQEPKGDPYQSKANLGIAKVPDKRLQLLSQMFAPKKTTPATVDFIDIAGIAKGASSNSISSAFLNQIRAVDALLHVARKFESANLEPPIPLSEALSTVRDELLLADLEVVEKRIKRLRKDVLKTADREARNELALMERSLQSLEAEIPMREMELSTYERQQLRGFGLFTLKPELLVVNVGEEMMADATGRRELEADCGEKDLSLSAPLEKDIATLEDPDERTTFLEEYGLKEPARDRLLRGCYRLLGRISFFTVGSDEVRAWTIAAGTRASVAAGTIHSDLQRGFIRAEVVTYDDLIVAGSLPDAKRRGKVRLEGKDYEVCDGDILNIRFNV